MLKKSSKLKMPWQKSRQLGMASKWHWKTTRTPKRSYKQINSSQHSKNTWVSCRISKQESTSTALRTILNFGNKDYNKLARHLTSWSRSRDNGFTSMLFLHHNRIKTNNLSETSINSWLWVTDYRPIWRESREMPWRSWFPVCLCKISWRTFKTFLKGWMKARRSCSVCSKEREETSQDFTSWPMTIFLSYLEIARIQSE